MTGAQLALGAGFWLLLAAVVLVLKLTEAALPIAGDQGIYSHIGQAILHGALPYRDLWEMKPPGVFYVRAAVLALAPPDWDFGCLPGPFRAPCAWLALQAADYLYTLLFGVALFITGRAVGLQRSAALMASFFGAVFISLVRISQQGLTPEKLLLLPATLALYCALRGLAGSRGWWVVSGVALALVMLLKQSGLIVVVPVALLAMLAEKDRMSRAVQRLSLVALGGGMVVALVLLAMVPTGMVWPMIEGAFLLNLARFGVSSAQNGFGGETALRDAWDYFRSGLAPFWLLGGAGVLAALGGGPGRLKIVAVWALLSSVLLLRIRDYLLLTPSYALLAGWALESLWQATRQPPFFGLKTPLAARALVVGCLASVAVLSGGLQGSVTMRVINERGLRDFIRSPDEWVADRIRQLPPGPMYIWGNAAHLYLMTGRTPASRYLNNTFFLPGWPYREAAYTSLLAELKEARPEVIVINPTIYWDDLAIERFPELLQLLEEQFVPVELSSQHGNWRLYQRKPGV